MRRYRYTTLFANRVGDWRETRREALEDAVAADLAEHDDEEVEGIRLDLAVWIDECEAGQEPRPLSDWEAWACATETMKTHGPAAVQFAADRIVALALSRDVPGSQAWWAIGERIAKLQAHGDRRH